VVRVGLGRLGRYFFAPEKAGRGFDMTHVEVAKAARDWAMQQVGCKYSQAKRTQKGIFDCSSLVARAYSAVGKKWLYGGSVPISCYEVYDDDFELIWPATYAEIGKKKGGASVLNKAKQPGDLQFLNTQSTGRANKITHVAMVASASKIVHARGTAYGVRTDSLTHYAGKVCAVVRYNPDCDLVVGHKGFRTRALQRALNERGADLSGDGEFGPKTQAAVKAFQKSAGLPVTGRADTATRAALGLLKAVTDPAVEVPAMPNEPAPTSGLRVTGGAVNLRTGPGKGFEIVQTVKKGAILAPAAVEGWRPVLVNGQVLWISAEYTEVV
jgi:hypothetical protein